MTSSPERGPGVTLQSDRPIVQALFRQFRPGMERRRANGNTGDVPWKDTIRLSRLEGSARLDGTRACRSSTADREPMQLYDAQIKNELRTNW